MARSIVGALKSAQKSYEKFASNKKVIAGTRAAEKVIMGVAQQQAKMHKRPEIAHAAGAGIGFIKASGGHNAKTRKKGRKELIKHGVPLAISAAKAYMTAGASAAPTTAGAV